jgi:nucleoside diphosphate kinase
MSNVKERTYIMVKPDGVQRSLIGKIITRFEARGYKLIALKIMRAAPELLRQRRRDSGYPNSAIYSCEILDLDYIEQKDEPYFEDLIKFMASGPVVPMVWEGLGAINTCRAMLGATHPICCVPGQQHEVITCRINHSSYVQALFEVILLLRLDVMSATAQTPLSMPRGRSNCKMFPVPEVTDALISSFLAGSPRVSFNTMISKPL